MRVGLFGGSFDPLHNGHVALARAAVRQKKLDRLYFVLSRTSPFKVGKTQTPVKDRLAMLRLGVPHSAKLRIATWELKGRGPAYSINTVKRYAKQHPQHELFFILGSDSWAGFFRWKEPDALLTLATVLIGRRPGAKLIKIPSRWRHRAHVLTGLFPNLSSTRIRRFKKNKNQPGLPKKVANYLINKQLYS